MNKKLQLSLLVATLVASAFVKLIPRIDLYLEQKHPQISGIEQVYVISLDRTPERYRYIQKQLDYYNIQHIRFSAIDGYKVKLINTKTKEKITGNQLKAKILPIRSEYNVQCKNTNDFLYKIIQHTLQAGEFGCACSHKLIWEDILKNKYSAVMILEDDINLSSNFKSELKHLLKFTPRNYDIIFLDVDIHSKYLNPNYKHPKLYKINLDSIYARMHAYIISYQGALKLLNKTRFLNLAIDLHMAMLTSQGVLNTYVAKKPIASINFTLPSEIDAMGRKY